MAGSRQELVAWVNELLSLGYTKVEQLGSGDAYCQIMDSIYGNLPLHRVKFGSRHEYDYVTNYKVLQNCFLAHKIDKPIPVDRLIKCKMQDNLEFVQWLRRYWDANYPGGEYDPIARRGASSDTVLNVPATRSSNASTRRPTHGDGNRPALAANSSMKKNNGPDQSVLQNLQKELQEERNTVAGLEKERDFYFGKLREIELMIQQELERSPEQAESPLLKDIQAVLYSTEEGFEIPEEGQAAEEGEGGYPDETF
ncbi:hypothetical protein BGZ65_005292 [Modicella reniformis]|uniref:Uncharacterized protein n=1 Tax=Modicella reniformis TaxID=1440133 RepID=A0A9P6M8L9_9FUNG|nr:hypothetical protein BGZ65_005292 [Modicella reniformis]